MNLQEKQLMVYGANGYSARLITEELQKKNIRPILAGRNEKEIKLLAALYKCEYRIFDLDDDQKTIRELTGIHTLLNCAGPFRATAKDLMDACLLTGTNYLDITGEIPVMALAFSYNQKAKEKGIVILPSVGFDIIPTDCLAKRLSELMPDATDLKLGVLNKGGGISRGTWLTSLEFIGGKGKILRDGKIIDSPLGEFSASVHAESFSFHGLSIPWGDVYSSFQSTGIRNIMVYLGVPFIIILLKPVVLIFLKLMKLSFIKKLAAGYIKKNLTGPDEKTRNKGEVYIWGKVENQKGETIEEVYQFIEGYTLTAKGAAESAARVLAGEVKPGTYTPSLAFGSDFMNQFIVKTIYKSNVIKEV
jgi:short subunit dehydrogenase-like uncharacterized protein